MISEQLLNTIVGYLAKQPYAEVAQLINAIHEEVITHRQAVEQQQPEQQEQNE